MAIKWKNWTANRLVKIIAFVLAVLCMFGGIYALATSRISWSLSSYSPVLTEDYYYGMGSMSSKEQYAEAELERLLGFAITMAQLESEAAISDDKNWSEDTQVATWVSQEHLEGAFDPSGEYYTFGMTYLVASEVYLERSTSDLPQLKAELIKRFREAEKQLKDAGVSYSIKTGGMAYSSGEPQKFQLLVNKNILESNFDSWEGVTAGSSYGWDSSTTSYGYDGYIPLNHGEDQITLSTDASKYDQYQVWFQQVLEHKRQGVRLLLLLGVVGLACLVVLSAGAGRKPKDDQLYFTLVDRPYLDLSLGGILLGSVIVIALCQTLIYQYNPSAVWLSLLMFALLTIFPFTPLLGWYISFCKYFKKGKWWEHTLTFQLGKWVIKTLKGWIELLFLSESWIWLGVCLTGTLAMVLLGFLSPWSLPLSGLVLAGYFFVHYLNVSRLRLATRKIEQGEFHQKVPITVGSLLPVARSVEHISAGMDRAISEQLRSERLKTELITNVSHDLRTPLTSIITYGDLLKTKGLDSPEATGYLDVLIGKSLRLKDLTDALFEATKAASGELKVELETLDLVQLINQCLGELEQKVHDSQLDFRVNMPEEALVVADGKLLWRVLENLFSNLFKYALKGSRVYLDLLPMANGHQLEVKNISALPLNISADQLTDRFFRGDSSRSTDGSGLGLSIVESFVAAQKGTFEIIIDGDLFKTILWLPSTEGEREEGDVQ